MDALLWQERTLSLLDQSKYPRQEIWHECSDFRAVAALLGSPAVRGEAIISVAGAYAYCLAALEYEGSAAFYKQLSAAKESLLSACPDSPALRAAIQTLEQTYEEYRSSPELITALLAAAVTIHRKDVIACRSMNRHGRDIVPKDGKIVVSATGGSFHTGGIGGILGVLLHAHRKEGLARVFVCEHRPHLEGRTLTHELLRLQVPVSLISDHSAASLMPRPSCDMLLLEGIQVAANGDLLVAPGGYGLAIAAYFHSIQVYATAFSEQIELDCPDGSALSAGQDDSAALSALDGKDALPESARPWTAAFDIVPGYLLTGLITERGLAFPDFSESLPALLAKREEPPVVVL